MLFFKILICITSMFLVGISFASEQNCQKFLNTVWKGEKIGKGYQGPITIKFKGKCGKGVFSSDFQISYVWIGKSGQVVTPGYLKFKKMAWLNTKIMQVQMGRWVWIATNYTGRTFIQVTTIMLTYQSSKLKNITKNL